MFKQIFLILTKKVVVVFIVLSSTWISLKAQNYCYTENFVGTELRAEPTDSLEENVISEIPLKSDIKVLFKTGNGYYFAIFDSKFGYVNSATVSFKESFCRASLG